MTVKGSLLQSVAYLIIISVFISLILIYSKSMFQATLLFVILISLIGPISIRSITGRLDPFEPLVIANISLFFMFFGRPLAELITDHTIHLGYTILATFDEALFLAWIGILSFQVGYASSLKHRLAGHFPSPPAFQPSTAAISAWLFTTIGATLFSLFLFTQGGFEVVTYLIEGRQASNNELFLRSTGYLYNGILMWGPAALIFFAIAVVYKKIHMLIPSAMLILPLLILYGCRGTRSHLLPLAISIPVFWYMWKRRRPCFQTIFMTGLIGLALLGWLREVREIETKDQTIQQLKTVLCSPFATIADLLTSPDTEMFDSMANELAVVPETLGFIHGATFTDILIRAVPRTLWPNKPLESNDAIVNELWSEHYSRSRASPAFSVIGVFYADSGFISVILGMFFIGVFFSASWRWLQMHSTNLMAQLIYSMGLPFVVILLRGNIPDTLSRMLFYFAPLLTLMIGKRLLSQSTHSRNNQSA